MFTTEPISISASILSPAALSEVISEHNKYKDLVDDLVERIQMHKESTTRREPAGSYVGTARYCCRCSAPYDTGSSNDITCPRCGKSADTERLHWSTARNARLKNLTGRAELAYRVHRHFSAEEAATLLAGV